jgi:hypothetical protein
MTMSYNSTVMAQSEDDTTRAMRFFVGLGNSITGNDQTYVGTDGYAVNSAGQYMIANPNGTQSVLGLSRSNLQGVQGAAAPSLITLGLIGFLIYHVMKG